MLEGGRRVLILDRILEGGRRVFNSLVKCCGEGFDSIVN